MFVARAAQVAVIPPSAMYKSTQTYTATNAYSAVPGWVADTATAPGSTLSGNGVVVQGSKTSALISATVPMTSNYYQSITVSVRLLVNGVVVVTGSTVTIAYNPNGGSATALASGTANVALGDVVTLQVISSVSGYGTVSAGTGTWVHIT